MLSAQFLLYGSMRSLYITAHLKTSYALLKRCAPWENAFHFFKNIFMFEMWIRIPVCLLYVHVLSYKH